VKQLGRKANNSPLSGTEVKNGGAVPPRPHMSLWHSAQLIKHMDNFTFTLPYYNSHAPHKILNVTDKNFKNLERN
jgi:hypothetical protein